MGSHSLQAVALLVFLLGTAVLCAGIALDGILMILVGAGAVAVSAALFRRCKQLEEAES